MLPRLLRILLLGVMTFLTLGLVVALARPEFGSIEKIVLALAAAGVIAAAASVRRIGRTPIGSTQPLDIRSWLSGRREVARVQRGLTPVLERSPEPSLSG